MAHVMFPGCETLPLVIELDAPHHSIHGGPPRVYGVVVRLQRIFFFSSPFPLFSSQISC
jgi:hypothetical protein